MHNNKKASVEVVPWGGGKGPQEGTEAWVLSYKDITVL